MHYYVYLFFLCFVATPALSNDFQQRFLAEGITVCNTPEQVKQLVKDNIIKLDCTRLTFPSRRVGVLLRGVELLYTTSAQPLVLVELRIHRGGIVRTQYSYMLAETFRNFNLPFPGEIIPINKKLRIAEFFGGEHLYE